MERHKKFLLTVAGFALVVLMLTIANGGSMINQSLRGRPVSLVGTRNKVKPPLESSPIVSADGRKGSPPAPVSSRSKANHPTQARLRTAYGRLPLNFEANQGQTDSQVKFLARNHGYTLFLTSNEAVWAFHPLELEATEEGHQARGTEEKARKTLAAVLRMQLVTSTPYQQVVGLDKLPGKSNYFNGNDPKAWRTNIPTYAKVKYREVYPGIDLVYYGNQRQLEYDFLITPGGNARAITLAFHGDDSIEIDNEGSLLMQVGGRQIQLHKPFAYQQLDGLRTEVAASYVLKDGHQIGFEVAAYDRSRALVIDPILSYSTYLGGSGYDDAASIAVDGSGRAYVTGRTFSLDFPSSLSDFLNIFVGGELQPLIMAA